MSRAWPAVLEGPGFVLRPLRYSDEHQWHQVRSRNREWLTPWNGTVPEHAKAVRTFRAMVRELRRNARNGVGYPFVVEADGKLIGQVSVFNIVHGSAQFGSIGYWIDEAYAGKGITPLAVAMVVDHCLFTAHLHRIEIAIRPENEKSLRVAEKLGLTEFGYARRYLHNDHQWRDHRLFSVDREDVPDGLVARLDANSH